MKVRVKEIDFLEMLLIKSGFTKSTFAQETGLSQSTIYQIIKGKRNPSPVVAKKICMALRTEFDDLFEITRK